MEPFSSSPAIRLGWRANAFGQMNDRDKRHDYRRDFFGTMTRWQG